MKPLDCIDKVFRSMDRPLKQSMLYSGKTVQLPYRTLCMTADEGLKPMT